MIETQRTLIIAAAALGILLLSGCNKSHDGPQAGGAEASGDRHFESPPIVTSVEGPSWLNHLGISNSMGRLGGAVTAPVSPRREPNIAENIPGTEPSGRRGMGGMMQRIYPVFRSNRAEVASLMNEKFTLTGSDLYRLNCQACHGPDGEGSPPTVKSLIGPVQGTSVAFEQERMEKIGRPISEDFARQLADTAEATLLNRLKHGGQQMPPFRHLRGDEVNALIQYLRELAGVPDSGRPILVPQSVARVGEHLVKGTCHICHDATGPGGGQMAMMRGIIPSLASMPEQQSLQDVVRQVELGSSPMMGMMGGPTMPAFPYITQDEAAAAYLYLLEYTPKP